MRTGCRVVWVWRRPTAVAAAARTAATFSSCAAARPGRSKHLSMICLLSSLVKKTIVHCINHLPSYLVESRLYEPSETSGPTNGDRSSSLRIATGPSCKRFLKKHFCIHVRVWAKGVTLFTFTDRKAPWSLIKMWGGGVWGRSAVRSCKDSFSHIFPY